jgi:hypothetical protein
MPRILSKCSKENKKEKLSPSEKLISANLYNGINFFGN